MGEDDYSLVRHRNCGAANHVLVVAPMCWVYGGVRYAGMVLQTLCTMRVACLMVLRSAVAECKTACCILI